MREKVGGCKRRRQGKKREGKEHIRKKETHQEKGTKEGTYFNA